MTFPIELPKWAQVGFAELKIKPIGPMEIDWSNPLTRGLKIAHVPQTYSHYDLASKSKFEVTNNTPKTRPDQGKLAYVLNTTATQVLSPFSTNVKEPAVGEGHTLLTTFRADNTTGDRNWLLSNRVTDGGSGFAFYTFTLAGTIPDQTVRLYMVYGGVAEYQFNTTIRINDDFVPLAIAGTLNGDYDSYINGEQADNVSVGTLNANTDSIALYADPFNNDGLTGAVEYTYYFDRRLSHEEIREITRDPYQLLKPAIPLAAFFNLDVAAPSGRIMGSIANQGGLAGRGGIAGPGGGIAG